MANLILLYNNFADAGALSGGSWTLPLSYMQDPQPSKRAQSANLSPASTTFKIALTGPKALRAIVFGPCNFVGGETYRIRGFTDTDFLTLVANGDSGVQTVGSVPVSTFDLDWEDPNWWTGLVPLDAADKAGGGVWVIHVFSAEVTTGYWQIDIDAQGNPDGVVKIGRLFMGESYIPTYNYAPDGNRFGFNPHTGVTDTPAGSRFFNPRSSARTFVFELPVLPASEVRRDIYRIARLVDLHQQVFVIPDPDDTEFRTRDSFLGYLEKLPDWARANVDRASTGFQIIEAL